MRLTAAVEDVGATGRLDMAIGVKGGDEAGRLATAFNGMLYFYGTAPHIA